MVEYIKEFASTSRRSCVDLCVDLGVISDVGMRRFGGYHEAGLAESFRMSKESSQTAQTSPHYDQSLHLHLHLRLHLRLHLQACAILRHWGNAATGRPAMRGE